LNTLKVKIIASGEISSAVSIKGLAPTAGAKKAIEAAGGKIEE
jgi:large subunit ribosomal protein L15